MKKCTKCNETKEIESFYKNNKMKDGRLKTCNKCTSKQASEYWKNRYDNDPEFREKEMIRNREKFLRLYAKNKTRPEDYLVISYARKDHIMNEEEIAINKRRLTKLYNTRHPEKVIAVKNAKKVQVEKGKERHHWSYKQEHWIDIIPLSIKDHKHLHSKIRYDKEKKLYRDLNGVLLETKQSHIDLLDNQNEQPNRPLL